MRFKEWKLWFRRLPLSLKWFVILILSRPIIDNFYYLKEVSPFFSPLYIVGVLTPLLIILSHLTRSIPRKQRSPLDSRITVWSGLVVLQSLLVLITASLSLSSIETALKVTTPVLLYFYVRRFVQEGKDIEGLLQTAIYAALLPFMMLLYENFVAPIDPTFSRGNMRLQGAYADIMNYAIYMSLSFLAAGYFFMNQIDRIQRRFHLRIFVILSSICLVGVFSINQISTFMVFGSLLLLFIYHNLRTGKPLVLLVMIFMIIAGNAFYDERIDAEVSPVFQKEISVFRGDEPIERAFHGRFSRWINYLERWSNYPIAAQLFGLPLVIDGNAARAWVLISSHSDYTRILFLTGIIGLLFYLGFLLAVYRRSRYQLAPNKFLIQGALLIVVLYSVSTVPTIYPPLMYIILPIFAFAAICKRNRNLSTYPQHQIGSNPESLSVRIDY
jgi:O-antigen ligase